MQNLGAYQSGAYGANAYQISAYGMQGGTAAYVPFGGHATLANDIVAYWAMDEAGGIRYDSVGSFDLTDNNTVTSVTGAPANMPSTVAKFTHANAETLSSVAHIHDWANPFTIAGWTKHPGIGTSEGIVRVNGVTESYVYMHGSGATVRSVFWGTQLNRTVTGSNWNHVVFAWDGVDYWLFVNGDTGTSGPETPGITTHGIIFGKNTPLNYHNGTMCGWGVWSRVLTSGERTDLYGAGGGLPY